MFGKERAEQRAEERGEDAVDRRGKGPGSREREREIKTVRKEKKTTTKTTFFPCSSSAGKKKKKRIPLSGKRGASALLFQPSRAMQVSLRVSSGGALREGGAEDRRRERERERERERRGIIRSSRRHVQKKSHAAQPAMPLCCFPLSPLPSLFISA